MTMPDERTRALRWAGEFLRKVQLGEEFSAEIKREVQYILRHYPRDHEIEHQALLDAARSKTVGEQWLGTQCAAHHLDVIGQDAVQKLAKPQSPRLPGSLSSSKGDAS